MRFWTEWICRSLDSGGFLKWGWQLRSSLPKTNSKFAPEKRKAFFGENVKLRAGLGEFLLMILLIVEILHHLGCIKPCKYWDKLHISWCRISSINSNGDIFFVVENGHTFPVIIRLVEGIFFLLYSKQNNTSIYRKLPSWSRNFWRLCPHLTSKSVPL